MELKFHPRVSNSERRNVEVFASKIPGFKEMFSDYVIIIHDSIDDEDLRTYDKILAFYSGYEASEPLIGVYYHTNILVFDLCIDVHFPLRRSSYFHALITKQIIFLPDYPHDMRNYDRMSEQDQANVIEFLRTVHKIHQQVRSQQVSINQVQAMMQTVNRSVEPLIKHAIETSNRKFGALFTNLLKLGSIVKLYFGESQIEFTLQLNEPVIPDRILYEGKIYKVSPQRSYKFEKIKVVTTYSGKVKYVEVLDDETQHPHVAVGGDVCMGDLNGCDIETFAKHFIPMMTTINLHSVYRDADYLEDLISREGTLIDASWGE